MENTPLVTNDAVVLGMLMVILGFVFYTASRPTGLGVLRFVVKHR